MNSDDTAPSKEEMHRRMQAMLEDIRRSSTVVSPPGGVEKPHQEQRMSHQPDAEPDEPEK